MADSRFSFEGLIAKNAPEARDAPVVKRGKYDFAVAYPDPASLPIDGLHEGLKEAMEQGGGELALYGYLAWRLTILADAYTVRITSEREVSNQVNRRSQIHR